MKASLIEHSLKWLQAGIDGASGPHPGAPLEEDADETKPKLSQQTTKMLARINSAESEGQVTVKRSRTEEAVTLLEQTTYAASDRSSSKARGTDIEGCPQNPRSTPKAVRRSQSTTIDTPWLLSFELWKRGSRWCASQPPFTLNREEKLYKNLGATQKRRPTGFDLMEKIQQTQTHQTRRRDEKRRQGVKAERLNRSTSPAVTGDEASATTARKSLLKNGNRV
ncbi:hypothetical protein F2Q68_00030595 [Brassica cretica]|uniref:Uncharacterized protein n=1 Tax=Brassica cretica TaxID=69181 RepID=A0A8S9G5J5_BRACR|nr:hypothetical protein F2Q68_00030595 [Brassica cretica]